MLIEYIQITDKIRANWTVVIRANYGNILTGNDIHLGLKIIYIIQKIKNK